MTRDETTEEKPPAKVLGVRLLVIVLVAQFIIAGVLIYFAVNGWPWLPGPAVVGYSYNGAQ
ncbi:MAG: hypothetical protein F2813_02580 [Actinobacteria bacterium]|uniref:Unannotated protein n=1 Tax=freshwater metagenome TaxID=449393 RepID=A0A6J5ZLJ5_9ZZZZ|nr:hypothetical protein [Actinomycetota bacterium]